MEIGIAIIVLSLFLIGWLARDIQQMLKELKLYKKVKDLPYKERSKTINENTDFRLFYIIGRADAFEEANDMMVKTRDYNLSADELNKRENI